MAKVSTFYASELKHNIYSLFVWFAITITSIVMLAYFSVTHYNPAIFPLLIITIIFGTFKIIKNLIMIFKLKKLIEKVGIERSNTYIYLFWHIKKVSSTWATAFFTMMFLIVGSIYYSLYAIGNEGIAPTNLLIGSTIIVSLSVLLTLTIGLINHQHLTNLIERHKNYVKHNDLAIEIENKIISTKKDYKKITIYIISALFIFPLILLIIPQYRKKLQQYLNE